MWHGSPNASVARLLEGCEVEPLTGPTAKRAGVLRQKTAGGVGPVDATVVETAVRRRAAVVTSDRGDVENLAVAARRKLSIIDV